MSEMPNGWVHAQLKSLLSSDSIFSDGDWIESKDQDPNGSIRLLQLADVGDGYFVDKSSRFVNEEKFAALNCTELKAGDVLIARMPDPLGRACLLPEMPQPCITVVDVAIFRTGKNGASNKWLKNAINSPQLRAFMESNSSGTTRKRIARGKLAEMELPVPPLNEQKRIANKLDAVLARVDACRDRLDRIPSILKRFRQSVLSAATSGKLSEDWRGISGAVGWNTLTLADICLSITDGDHQAPPQAETGIPFITISAINDGQLRLEKASRFVPKAYFEALKESRRPRRGDILFSVTGSIGIPAIVDTDSAFTFQRHIAILRPDHSKISSSYLNFALGAEDVRQQALAVATGTAQLTIPLTGLRSFRIEVPSVEEQTEIVRRVEALFAFADRLEARYTAARAQVEKLTPATLAKAFRGELVPQDPNEEPASALLDRIKLAGAKSAAKPLGKRTSKKPKPEQATKVALISLAKAKDDTMKKHSLTKLEDIAPNHLANILNTIKQQDAKAIWSSSRLSIDDFYVQLNREISAGLLRVSKDDESCLELVSVGKSKG